MRENIPWRLCEDVLLKSMYLSGETMVEIARAINRNHGTHRTKNAVIGRADRLNLPIRYTKIKEPEAKPEKPQRIRYKYHNDGNKPAPAPIPVNNGNGITILELTNISCRYITDDTKKLYCGNITSRVGGSYCQRHNDICYQKIRTT